MTEEKQEQDNLLRPKSGTATSSPHTVTASQSNKVFVTLYFMKKEAYADSTIRAVGKRLRHLIEFHHSHCEP